MTFRRPEFRNRPYLIRNTCIVPEADRESQFPRKNEMQKNHCPKAKNIFMPNSQFPKQYPDKQDGKNNNDSPQAHFDQRTHKNIHDFFSISLSIFFDNSFQFFYFFSGKLFL